MFIHLLPHQSSTFRAGTQPQRLLLRLLSNHPLEVAVAFRFFPMPDQVQLNVIAYPHETLEIKRLLSRHKITDEGVCFRWFSFMILGDSIHPEWVVGFWVFAPARPDIYSIVFPAVIIA
jgi:hypothetical protein